jgi:hypothetical protein
MFAANNLRRQEHSGTKTPDLYSLLNLHRIPTECSERGFSVDAFVYRNFDVRESWPIGLANLHVVGVDWFAECLLFFRRFFPEFQFLLFEFSPFSV